MHVKFNLVVVRDSLNHFSLEISTQLHIDSIEGSAMETWLNPSTNQINPVNDFKNHTDTTQASSYSSISRMELKTGIGSTLQPLSKTVSSSVAGKGPLNNYMGAGGSKKGKIVYA